MAALLSPGGLHPNLRDTPLPLFGRTREVWQPHLPGTHPSPCAKAAPIRCPNPKTTVTKTYQIEPREGPPPLLPPPPNGIEQICAHTSPARSQAASDIHAPWHGSPPLAHSSQLGISSPNAVPLETRHHSQPSRIPLPSAKPLLRPSWRDPSSLVQLVPSTPSAKKGPPGNFRAVTFGTPG